MRGLANRQNKIPQLVLRKKSAPPIITKNRIRPSKKPSRYPSM